MKETAPVVIHKALNPPKAGQGEGVTR